jgi:hypothetical protein
MYKIVTGAGTEYLQGTYGTTGGTTWAFTTTVSSTNRAFTADVDTKGRLAGSKLRFTCLSTTAWQVEGIVNTSGTAATAFSGS